MAYYGVNNIIGGHEAQVAEQNAPTHKSNLDKDDFLKLLVAQLNHQDPMSPMEDTEFTGQLAEYSSLEQLTNLNTGMEALIASNTRGDMLGAVSFIGKSVKATGYNIAKEDNTISTIHYDLGEPVTNLSINIYDKAGNVVRTEDLGSHQTGVFDYVWDGKNQDGLDQPDGVYSVGILAEDVNGKPVLVQTDISGKVSGVVTENGTQFLRLNDGRYVQMTHVREVVETATTTPDPEPATE